MSNFNDFDTWKDFLANRLEQAQEHGMSEQTIENVAHQVGDYLSKHVEPKNNEMAVIQELWDVASEEEQQAIANTMIKLVQDEGQ